MQAQDGAATDARSWSAPPARRLIASRSSSRLRERGVDPGDHRHLPCGSPQHAPASVCSGRQRARRARAPPPRSTAHLAACGRAVTVALAGNIGVPAHRAPRRRSPRRLTVLELSSYQIADLEAGPEVAVVTNLYREHTDWHGSEHAYRARQAPPAGHFPRSVRRGCPQRARRRGSPAHRAGRAGAAATATPRGWDAAAGRGSSSGGPAASSRPGQLPLAAASTTR